MAVDDLWSRSVATVCDEWIRFLEIDLDSGEVGTVGLRVG